MVARWLCVLLVVGCVRSSSVSCPVEGTLCPANTECATVGGEVLCVSPEDKQLCEGMAEFASCATGKRCYDGVCLAGGCGNGRVDPDEACDDENTVTGDGCSADCLSDETCGNHVVDLIKGEGCDDGPDGVSHDGCASDCSLEFSRWSSIPNMVDSYGGAWAYDIARSRLVMLWESRGALTTWEHDGRRWILRTPAASPAARSDHAMAYDAERKVVVLFGGSLFDDTWEWDGTTWTLRSPAVSPPPRRFAAMVYDPVGKRIVLFGGLGGAFGATYLGDTWAWDGDTWTPIQSVAAPSARMRAAMTFDPTRGGVLLFGGNLMGSVNSAETWRLAGATWTQQTPALSPTAGQAYGMAFDPRSGKVVLYGGATASGFSDETWVWDGTTWSPHPAVGPQISAPLMTTQVAEGSVVAFDRGRFARWDDGWTVVEEAWSGGSIPRFAAAAAVDVAGRRVVVHGGIEGATTASTLVYTGVWRRFLNSAAGSSPGRVTDAAMAFDARRSQFVLFGGFRTGDPSPLAETWVFDGATATWTQKFPAGVSPPGRYGHALVYDAAHERVVLFGGSGDAGLLNDTWTWDGTAWQLMPVATPPVARDTMATSYDPIREVVVLFGGRGALGARADTHEWNGTTWTQRMVSGPTARSGAGFAWDASRRRSILFGGGTQASLLADHWEWDGTAWSLAPAVNAIKARSYHVMVSALDGGGVLVFGGSGNAATTLDDLQWLRYEASTPDELCDGSDRDLDTRARCDDDDCWRYCSPLCPPGTTTCGTTSTCGDGVCDPLFETCTHCPADCGACTMSCGDHTCGASETPASCPGDC